MHYYNNTALIDFLSESSSTLRFLITGRTNRLPSNMSWENLSKESEKNILKLMARRASSTSFRKEFEKMISDIDKDESYPKPEYFQDISEYYRTNIVPLIKSHEAKRLAWLAEFRFKGIMVLLCTIIVTMLLFSWSSKFNSDFRFIFLSLCIIIPFQLLNYDAQPITLINERIRILENTLKYFNLKLYNTPTASLEELFKYGVRNAQPFNHKVSSKYRDYLVGFKNEYKIEIVHELLQPKTYMQKNKFFTEAFVRITLPTTKFNGTNVFNAKSINALAPTTVIPAQLTQLNIEDPYQKLDPSITGIKSDFSDYTMSLYKQNQDQFLSNSEMEGKSLFNEHFVSNIAPALNNALFQKNIILLKQPTRNCIRSFLSPKIHEAATFHDEISSIISLCSTISAVIEHVESFNTTTT